ncbi:hypothetical protein PHYPSEUDO_004538 [Phytophthora pseudosyringae]|uniref:Uncharacterized protein n=1 Tax=Phytophthora pseudosyringae TaxID=221518 RepID=A0A8T1WKI0_9STRA|nr:hypothetical protein PHYPSEUDO_004538 [Phytophthora pseudosyringae]
MAASMFTVILLLLVSDVRAQSSSSSSSSAVAAVEISVVNTTNATDTCSQDEYTSDCWYPATCKTCLSRAGCAVEVSTGRCVSSSSLAFAESSSSELSSAQYFPSGGAHYCSGSDPACFTCRRGSAPAVCVGSSGCVCVSQCELISPRPTKCMPGPVGNVSYGSLIAAAAVFFPLVTFMVFKGSPCPAGCSFRRSLHRRRREKNRRKLPGGLKLDAWRNHLGERAEPVDEQLADLELRSCFVPMTSARHHQQRAGGAETGEAVHVEAAAVSRAVAATDLPFSPTAGGFDARPDRAGPELV